MKLIKYQIFITKLGYKKVKQATSSIQHLELSKFIFSNTSKTITPDIEELPDIVYENYITHKEEISEKHFQIQTVIPVWEGGFTITALGVLDNDGDLILAGNIPPSTQPVLREGATKEHDVKLDITIDHADNISIVIDPEVTLVTRDRLAFELQQVLDLIDDKVTFSEMDDAIADLVGEAPEVLDTLQELAEALDNDPNFATSITQELAGKVDIEEGKMLSSNDFTDLYKQKLDILQYIDKISDLKQDIPYLLDKDLDPIRKEIKGNTELIHREVADILEIIQDLNPGNGEVDLSAIIRRLNALEEEKADKEKVEESFQDIITLIEELLLQQLEEINTLLGEKANQSEIDRLEETIKELITGEDKEYIVPRITDNPVLNEIYYQNKSNSTPAVSWRGDDWGSWDVSDNTHLKLDSHGSYSGAEGRVLSGEGTITMEFIKEDPKRPYSIVQLRDNKTILDTGYIKTNKKHTLFVKAGDRIKILGAFKGSVYIDYISIINDVRLSVYKNGKIEEVANKRLVEERLENVLQREEFESKVGSLHDLTTDSQDNLVEAINEINAKELEGESNSYIIPRITDDAQTNEIYIKKTTEKAFVVNFDRASEDVVIEDGRFIIKDFDGYASLEFSIVSGKGNLEFHFTDVQGYYSFSIYPVDGERIDSGWINDNKTFNYEVQAGDRLTISTGADLVFHYTEPDDIVVKTLYFENEPINTEYDDTDILKGLTSLEGQLRYKANEADIPTKLSELSNDEGFIKKDIEDISTDNKYNFIIQDGVPYLQIIQ